MKEISQLTVARIEISCAHFVHTAEASSKCQCLHGHNYYVDVSVEGELQKDGMLIDAHHIKNLVNVLDHKTLIPMDLLTDDSECAGLSYVITNPSNLKQYVLPKEDVCVLDVPATTAEHLAKRIANKIMDTYPGIKAARVSFQETNKMEAAAVVTRDD